MNNSNVVKAARADHQRMKTSQLEQRYNQLAPPKRALVSWLSSALRLLPLDKPDSRDQHHVVWPASLTKRSIPC